MTAVLIVVGENQFVIVHIDGIYKSINDFPPVIKAVDITVLIPADSINDFFLSHIHFYIYS